MKPKQHKAAILIAQGISKQETAKQCEVCPETISNWSRDEVFKNYLLSIQRENYECAKDLYRDNALLAAETLVEIMKKTNNDSLKTKICLRLLEAANIGVRL